MKRLFVSIIVFLLMTPPALASRVYPADPDSFSKQWHLEKIQAYDAWGKTKGSDKVVVAVIDTGLDLDHPDIAQNLWTNPKERVDGLDNDNNFYVDDAHGWDFIDGDSDPSPNLNEDLATGQAVNHGTMVAGLIGAVGNNGISGTGLAWQVKLMPLRALDSRGRGNVGTVIEAVRYAIRQGADIINLSFVGPGFDRDLFLVLQEAGRKGILVVAAVGNNEQWKGLNLDEVPLYPVCYSGGTNGEDVVLGVAALDKNDKKFLSSNYGKSCVDLSAPGVNMYSTLFYSPNQDFNDYFGGDMSGSSMAAPLVSGAAALIKSLNPSYGAQELRAILLQSADSLEQTEPEYFQKLGAGRLNVNKALELAISGVGAIQGPRLSSGSSYLLTAPYSSAKPEVQILLPSGTRSRSFLAYGNNFTGGVRFASGDVNKDGQIEIITGAGLGGGPHVRVFTTDGLATGSFFAYDTKFRGGVNIGVGDLNGDGQAEIVTAPGHGGGPQIRIFSNDGKGQYKVIGSFFAYNSKLKGGVNLTVADIDGDGLSEIITAPGSGLGYQGEIKIFNLAGKLKTSFKAYPASFSKGVNVAVGSLEGSGLAQIITAPMKEALPEVRVYSATGQWQRAFLAYAEGFTGGVNLAVEDLDRDGLAEIITGPGKGGGAHVIVFDGFGRIKNQFFPMDKNFRGGVSVGVIRL